VHKGLKRLKPRLSLQPSPYTCGPAALKNALLAHNVTAGIRRLIKLSKTTKAKGTDEKQLRVAAREVGFDLWHYSATNSELIKENVRHIVLAKTTCLVTVDRWSHWVAVMRCNHRHVWVADSSRPGPVLQRWTWLFFLSRMAVWMRPGENKWDIYALAKLK
jgi:ABC-type bacteriocin/lantibiotic exporter with double-glycine peptidase domain